MHHRRCPSTHSAHHFAKHAHIDSIYPCRYNVAWDIREFGTSNQDPRKSSMAQAQPISFNRHPYADGGTKKMLIDGKWLDATSGKTFESRNPATGELLATVAEGDKADINA